MPLAMNHTCTSYDASWVGSLESYSMSPSHMQSASNIRGLMLIYWLAPTGRDQEIFGCFFKMFQKIKFLSKHANTESNIYAIL